MHKFVCDERFDPLWSWFFSERKAWICRFRCKTKTPSPYFLVSFRIPQYFQRVSCALYAKKYEEVVYGEYSWNFMGSHKVMNEERSLNWNEKCVRINSCKIHCFLLVVGIKPNFYIIITGNLLTWRGQNFNRI